MQRQSVVVLLSLCGLQQRDLFFHIEDADGKHITWGIGQYLKYGVVNYLIQISIALIAMIIIL